MRIAMGFLAFAFLAMGQSGASQGPPTPLAVTWTSGGGSGALALSVQNVSTTRIRAYVVQIAFTNAATGASLGQFVRSSVKPVKDGKPTYVEPGQSVQAAKAITIPRDPSGNLAKVSIVSIDSVIFADGSQWGPAKLPQSQKVVGMLEAMDRGMTSK